MNERTARALLNLDPTHEEAARALISARAANGDVGGALGIYKTLWEVLADEYDTEPSKPTQDLIARIKLDQPLTTGPSVAGSSARSMSLNHPLTQAKPNAGQKLVIEVSEFEAAATKDEQRYLVQGFRRELIACLVRFREWMVCNRPSALGSAAAGNGSAADFVIEASAFQAGDDVRLVLMLKEVATNAYLSERAVPSLDAELVRRTAIGRTSACNSTSTSIFRRDVWPWLRTAQ